MLNMLKEKGKLAESAFSVKLKNIVEIVKHFDSAETLLNVICTKYAVERFGNYVDDRSQMVKFFTSKTFKVPGSTLVPESVKNSFEACKPNVVPKAVPKNVSEAGSLITDFEKLLQNINYNRILIDGIKY